MIKNTLMSIIEDKLSFCKQFGSPDWNKKCKRSNIFLNNSKYFVMFRFLEFSNSNLVTKYFAKISNGQLSHVIQQATVSAFTNGDHPRTRSRQFGSKQEGTACSLERLVHLKAILGK